MDSLTTLHKITTVILLIIIFFLVKCNNPNANIPSTDPIIRHVYISDTVKEVVVDTVIKYVKLEVPTPTPLPEDTAISVYRQLYNDTNLALNLTASVDGTLIAWDFDYKLKVPIKETITITNTDSIFITQVKPKNMLFLNGLVLGGNNQFDAGLGLSFYHKKGYLYQLNYMPVSKSIVAGFSYQFK